MSDGAPEPAADDLKQCGRCQAWIPAVATMCAYCGTGRPDERLAPRPPTNPLGLPHGVTVYRALIVANLVAYAASVFVLLRLGGGGNPLQPMLTGAGFSRALYASGAFWPPAVAAGEWWRVLAAGFLHVGALHLAVNLWSLRNLGEFFEALFGGARLIVVYVASGAAAVAAVYVWHVVVRGEPMEQSPGMAGASGSIFGIGAAMAVFMLRHRTQRAREIGRSLALSLAASFAFCFALPMNVSHAGHAGGALAGAFFGLSMSDAFSTRISPAVRRNWWLAAASCVLACVASLAAAFFHASS